MREIVMGLAASATLGGGGLWYSGAFAGGEVYPIAPREVAHQLAMMPMPAEINQGLDGNGLARLDVQRHGNDKVRWTVSVNGAPLAYFTAELSPEDAGTRVEVEFTPADTEEGRAAAKHTPIATKLVAAIAEIALAEQVDATLEKREVDHARIANQTAVWVASNPAEVYAYGVKMQAMFESADPELQNKVQSMIEANPPSMEGGPAEFGKGYGTEQYDAVAERDSYQASQPVDDGTEPYESSDGGFAEP